MATAVPRQDLPPAGGYEPIRYKRHLPARGPPGYVFFLAGAAAIIYGLYKVGEGNHKNWSVAPPGSPCVAARDFSSRSGIPTHARCTDGHRLIKQERVASRIALVPLLLAEEDRKYLKWKAASDAEEAELMKNVRGWKVGEKVYHTDRWVPPAQVASQ